MVIFRVIRSQWQWFVTNIIGWALAISSIIAVAIFALGELNYDRFHANAERIYRITLEYTDGSTHMHPARVVGDWPMQMQREYGAIERVARLVPFRKSVVKIDEHKLYLNQAFSTDSTFFDVFDVDIVAGQQGHNLTQPNRVLICRSLAEKYFGTINAVGKTISILDQQLSEPLDYTVEAVFEDFPHNSHFHPDILASLTEIEGQTTWAYTYALMAQGTDVQELQSTIQQKWDTENQSNNPSPTLHFQKLTDIHLHSQKTREIEQNSSLRSLLLLMGGAIIILLIAAVNFINLNRVKRIADSKRLIIKMINGAQWKHLVGESMVGSLILFFLSSILAIPLANQLSAQLGINILQREFALPIALLAGLFLLLLTAIPAIPVGFANLKTLREIKKSHKNPFTVPLLVQFSLSILAIACTAILAKQIMLINSLHPKSQSSSTIVMASNPWEAVQRYEVFKDELMRLPEVKSVTGAMEGPGGDVIDAMQFEMEGIDAERIKTINILTIDSNFFNVMGIEALAGTIELRNTPTRQWEQVAMDLSVQKVYQGTDNDATREMERKLGDYHEQYILNQSALQLLGIHDPALAVGKRFRVNYQMPYLFPQGKVVGVVPDFHYTNLFRKENPLVIVSRKVFNHCFIVDIDTKNTAQSLSAVEEVWNDINPDYPFQYQFISDVYQRVYSTEYAQVNLLLIFTIISIILSSLGVYAMSAFNMQRRVKEIGIRKVNGARIWQVMLMLNSGVLKWIAIAFVIATPIAYYAMSRWLENFAYKTALSWWIFALAGIVSLLVALLTVSWQSWRAAIRNPVEALRYE